MFETDDLHGTKNGAASMAGIRDKIIGFQSRNVVLAITPSWSKLQRQSNEFFNCQNAQWLRYGLDFNTTTYFIHIANGNASTTAAKRFMGERCGVWSREQINLRIDEFAPLKLPMWLSRLFKL
ncbi:uncharacterized protein EAF02_003366 [Botrytis sinoallii]|uniref:uncharacterized protein n=1 Tax=Botrytis sinoallii TaxID=1463999 RepID=UPI00190002F7|nr:uncharacterized protein EAF02_003366 [Botrytis sinoallii]KAF7886719.1 hypothetical protein EAF02_003366 [Botrytis sinoallii]